MSRKDEEFTYFDDSNFIHPTFTALVHIGIDICDFNAECFKKCKPYEMIRKFAGQSLNNYLANMGADESMGEVMVEANASCGGQKGNFIKGKFCGISVTTDIVAVEQDDPDATEISE